MKVIIINASARDRGNTHLVASNIIELLEENQIEVELINIGHMLIHGCIGCEYCHTESKENLCVFKDDGVNDITLKLREADGIIIGSPVYYGGITGTLKSFLDRVYYPNKDLLGYKVVMPYVVQRRDGGMDALRQIENYFALNSSYVVPSRYWNILHGRKPQEVIKDEEGMKNIEHNTRLMIEMLKKDFSATKVDVERKMTNFI